MNIKALKFGAPLTIYILAYFSFANHGWIISTPLLYVFAFIPLIELIVRPTTENMSQAEEQVAKSDKLYDFWLYLIVPFQYLAMYFFLTSIVDPTLTGLELTGRILSMGLLCGTFGINVDLIYSTG